MYMLRAARAGVCWLIVLITRSIRSAKNKYHSIV
jgi:hypothetical protein